MKNSHVQKRQPAHTSTGTSQWGNRFRSPVLQNSGSVARDHLANERTYLAWIRTALMMMTLSLAASQMYTVQERARQVLYADHVVEIGADPGLLRRLGRPLGVLTGVFSILVVFSGLFRYFSVQNALRRAEFPASRYIVTSLVVWCATAMVLATVAGHVSFT